MKQLPDTLLSECNKTEVCGQFLQCHLSCLFITLAQMWNSCIWFYVNPSINLVHKLFTFHHAYIWHEKEMIYDNFFINQFSWYFVILWTPPWPGEHTFSYTKTIKAKGGEKELVTALRCNSCRLSWHH